MKTGKSFVAVPWRFFAGQRGYLPSVALAATVAAAGGWAVFETVFDYTSTTPFCLSCHEMKVMQEELSATAHFRNRAGVRVECKDCHVPAGQLAKLVAKIRALDDVYAHVAGSIDTPEKFEARRLEMAEAVWASMRGSRSQPCQVCHSFDAMVLDKQSARPRFKHQQARESGATCIDCHKGIAHKLPEGFRNDDY
jgi:nitrate/TMAO reductase-like tetraheme cytochrome c subunit